MKKSLKTLMAVGIAGISMFSTFAFGGCGDEKGNVTIVDGTNAQPYQPQEYEVELYFVIDGILHKGKLVYENRETGSLLAMGANMNGAMNNPEEILYCGGENIEKEFVSFYAFSDIAFYNPKNSKEEITGVCEKCFEGQSEKVDDGMGGK